MNDKIYFNIEDKKLMYDNILVKIVDVQNIDDGSGIINPSQYGDKPEVGQVVLVGTGRLMSNGSVIPCIVKIGDTVLFNKYSSVKYRNPATGVDLYCIREEDIVAY